MLFFLEQPFWGWGPLDTLHNPPKVGPKQQVTIPTPGEGEKIDVQLYHEGGELALAERLGRIDATLTMVAQHLQNQQNIQSQLDTRMRQAEVSAARFYGLIVGVSATCSVLINILEKIIFGQK
jgi:hypothetical protein